MTGRFRVAVILLTAVTAQVTVFEEFRVAGVSVEFMLLVSVLAGYHGGPERGAVIAFCAGLLHDSLTATPMGLHALVYAPLAVATSHLEVRLARSTRPFLGVGLVLALSITGALGVLMLGEDTARGLGVKVSRVRTLALLAVTALCGAATAAVGPIAFVGLAVPMVARALMGHDLRWISACSLALGALWLLTADVLARVLAPEEVAAGIVAALVGGPVFVLVARRRRVPAL